MSRSLEAVPGAFKGGATAQPRDSMVRRQSPRHHLRTFPGRVKKYPHGSTLAARFQRENRFWITLS
jgi:hypothetical protein